MGIEYLYGKSPVVMAREALADPSDMQRRDKSRVRSKLLRGDGADVLKSEIKPLYTDLSVRKRVNAFARFTNSEALFKRLVGDMARPVYSIPPTRRVTPAGEQGTFANIVRRSRLNQRMALGLRSMIAAGDAALFDRYVPSLDRIVTSVLDAHTFTVIPHPDDPGTAAAYIYDRPVGGAIWHVYWDDEITFQFDADGGLQPFKLGDSPAPVKHGLARMPFTPLHLSERSDSFFDGVEGEDMVAGDLACRLLKLIGLRVLKVRGTTKIVVEGDSQSVPRDQIMDEENALQAEDGATIKTLGDQTDARHYLDFLRSTKEDVAANRGISRARLNRDKADASSDVGLLEVRADLVQIMTEVEQEHFEVLKMVSAESPDPIVPDATMEIDFGEWEVRTDREAELRIFEAEEKLGLSNILDMIAAKNPEASDERKQWAEYRRNIGAYAKRMEMVRALNAPADGNVREPGQDAERNGRMGPMVRDGRMSRDDAADKARGRFSDDLDD